MAKQMDIKQLETGDGTVVAAKVSIAKSMAARTMGLMFRKDLPEGEGIAIHPCNSIHMFFMRIAIDVAFVDVEGRVMHICHSIRPWRVSRVVFGAKTAIELPAGTLRAKGVEKGTVLRLV